MAAGLRLLGSHQLQYLLEGRYRIEVIEAAVGGTERGQALAGAQRAQFRQREILGEPAGHLLPVDRPGGPAGGEFRMVRDVGRAAYLIFMPGDEDAIPRQHQVRLDIVGALIDRALIGGERMFGPLAAGAAMSDDEGVCPGLCYHRRRHQQGEEEDGGPMDDRPQHPPQDHAFTPSSASS